MEQKNRLGLRLARSCPSFTVRYQFDGTEEVVGTRQPMFIITIHSQQRFNKIRRNPGLEIIHGYIDGSVTFDFFRGLHLGYLVDIGLAATWSLGAKLRALPAHLRWLVDQTLHSNNLGQMRRDIGQHYDMGFPYALMLGPSLQYTSAYYLGEDDTLEQAQARKLDVVLRKARLAEQLRYTGEVKHLDIGCGGGALVIEAARRGAESTGVALSHDQVFHANAIIADDQTLKKRCRVWYADWRELMQSTVQYDLITIICVLEHEAKAAYGLIEFAYRHLKPGGRLVMQGIVNPEAVPGTVRTVPSIGDQFLQGEVFPGSRIPKLWEAVDWLRRVGFCLDDVETFPLSYAKTCEAWVHNLINRRALILDQIPDSTMARKEQKVRRMEIYLRLCQRMFEHNIMSVAQFVATKGRVPTTGRLRPQLT